MELYILLIVGAAGVGGYALGLEGKDSTSGLMGSMLAVLIFAVPMGFWLVFNVAVYLWNDGRAGFRVSDVRQVERILAIGAAVWICGLIIGWVQRLRTKR
ncbi:hypothetical protein [Agrobacterium tumefaciens]|uniref:hypothetical protein n=1 Tax=Agrobacterium tumefaciens TaxID=358 RepID=UPI001574DE78|nr:hypothetical protein [Agrobacterium tumefaciens]